MTGNYRFNAESSNRDLFVHADQRQGEMRLTYARVQRKNVTALAIGVLTEPIEGIPCFQLGVAVPEAYRTAKDLRKEYGRGAIAEMRSGSLETISARFTWRQLSARITSHLDGLRWRLSRTHRKK